MSILSTTGIGLMAGSSIFSGISQYKQAKEQVKQLKANAELEIQQLLHERHDIMQEQKLIASAGGYVLEQGTSPLQLMLETERQIDEYANLIKAKAKKEAKTIKKAARNNAISSIVGGAGNIFGKLF